MSDILLARSPLTEGSAVFVFPASLTLQPGAEVTVFADANPSEGPMHAPFSLDSGGDDLSLLALRPSGARLWIHSLTVPALAEDESIGKIPGTELWVSSDEVIAPDGEYSGIAWDDGGPGLHRAALPRMVWRHMDRGRRCRGRPAAWEILETIPGDNVVHTLIRPLSAMTSLRASLTSLPAPLITATMPGVTEVSLSCYSPGAIAAVLFYSVSADLSGSRSLSLSLPPAETTFSFNPGILPGWHDLLLPGVDIQWHFRGLVRGHWHLPHS